MANFNTPTIPTNPNTSTTANTNAKIATTIDSVIKARKRQLPAIKAEKQIARSKMSALKDLGQQLDDLAAAGVDEDIQSEIRAAKSRLGGFKSQLYSHLEALDELEKEFNRDTLNIGVSGAARVGKSTTLQHMTGLTDTQIPTGGLNPVTAVRSEIYNSNRNCAVITFKTVDEFLSGYVKNHVANVNQYLDKTGTISVNSLNDLKTVKLPDKLHGSTISAAATDSLKRLKEAQRSVSSYESLLGQTPKKVQLDVLRKYVSYPSPQDEQAEILGTKVCDRGYLAVKLAQVYCPFPQLGDAKVALVDLPGLGEIGNSANDLHLKGLESKVDQIFLVMKPSAEKAFADAEVARNLDQLNVVQPAVKRSDLVVCGVNMDVKAGPEAADNLVANFEAEINQGRADSYEVRKYNAVDDEKVSKLFSYLLKRMGERLPEMDKAKVEACKRDLDLDVEMAATLDDVVRSMNRVLKSIPSSDRVANDRINAIYRAATKFHMDYACKLKGAASKESEAYKKFTESATRIHETVQNRIDKGLFRANATEWNTLTSGASDYYNLYRDECKRIRYCIIDSYAKLDCYYDESVSAFKRDELQGLLRACRLQERFDRDAKKSVNAQICAVREELSGSLNDSNLNDALRLLERCRFDFRSNVFLSIGSCLDELENPSEQPRYGINRRLALGGSAPTAKKQENLRSFLEEVARKANDDVLRSLLKQDDGFNAYLAVSADFFNNALFGRDPEDFKQVVIRGMIREYKQYVLPDADDASKNPAGQKAKSIKELALELKSKSVDSKA